jgi:hypothetical protein
MLSWLAASEFVPASRPTGPVLFRPAATRWLARLALLTLILQLSSLGHWSLGPFHPGAADPNQHVQHCHGDTSSCGGQPTFVGTYVERPLLAEAAPTAAYTIEAAAPAALSGIVIETPHGPPRAI